MLLITLSHSARQQVEETFKTTPDRRLRARCQAILMAERARPHHHIAADLGISARTLQRWLNAYRVSGLDGLAIQWAAGRTPSIPAAMAPEILAWVKQGPCGLRPRSRQLDLC